MLSTLSINNIILIEKANLALNTGLSAFTGETGAGKSILFGAIGLILGERATPYLLRSGTEAASVTAVFTRWRHPFLEALLKSEDIPLMPEEDLMIRRTLHLDGKSRIFLNDTPVTTQLIREMAPYLIDIHGQFDRYLTPKDHLLLIDLYGKTKEEMEAVAVLYKNLKETEQALKDLLQNQRRSSEQLSYLKNALEEVYAIAPREGEHEYLVAQRKTYLDREKHHTLITSIKTLLETEQSPTLVVREALKYLSKMPEGMPHLQETLAAFDVAADTIAEAEENFHTFLHAFENEEFLSIDDLEKRLFALRGLAHKHHIPVHDLHLLAETLEQEVHLLENMETSLNGLESKIIHLKAAYIDVAQKLSKKRQSASSAFTTAVTQLLPALKLDHAIFDVAHTYLDEEGWRADGCDRLEFMISMNKGSSLAPLAKIASGGELSRLMLIFKYVLSECYNTPTLLFDEVDTGMGGAVAAAVGKLLGTIAQHKQVLVVTHAPQVASFAKTQYAIFKTTENHQTKTSIHVLTKEERIEELARMLSGTVVGETSRKAAQDMLESHLS